MQEFAPARVVRSAIDLLRDRSASLAKALALPAILLAVADATKERASELGWEAELLHLGFYSVVYAIFAVSCHRVLLLQHPNLPNRWGLYLTPREARFVGWSVVIMLMALPPLLLAALPISVVSVALPGALSESGTLSVLLLLSGGVPAWYVFARSSLVLPATAIDQRISMSRAWRLSRGNGWRLSLALCIPFLVMWALDTLIDLVFGEPTGPALSLVIAVGFATLTAFEVSVLSASYRALNPTPSSQAAA